MVGNVDTIGVFRLAVGVVGNADTIGVFRLPQAVFTGADTDGVVDDDGDSRLAQAWLAAPAE